MNSDTLNQLLQKGFRVTLGATATLIETLQDPQSRDANLSKLTSELSQLAEIWEAKGATTEVEARNFVNSLWQQRQTTPSAVETTATPVPPSGIQQDLEALTSQIAQIRAEIEKLRADDNP